MTSPTICGQKCDMNTVVSFYDERTSMLRACDRENIKVARKL